MYDKARFGTAAVLLGMLAVASCGRVAAQPGDKLQSTPVGVWDLKGANDDATTKWIGTLVLAQSKLGSVKGYIDWLGSNGHCGREHFAGTYDARTRVLKITGIQLEFANSIVRGTYRAELSEDGLRLDNGKWSDNDPTIPGSWSAKRVSLRH